MIDTERHSPASPAQTAIAPNAMGVDPEAAYNENQAATLLGVSVRTLQAWRVRGGGPPYVKIGRAVRYQRRALVTFQQQNAVTSTTEADARRSRS